MTATSLFHLREGFYYGRDGDEIVLRWDPPPDEHTIIGLKPGENPEDPIAELRVPVSEWASAVASTSVSGDVQEKWAAAVEYLNS
jgi:hypothetical protein